MQFSRLIQRGLRKLGIDVRRHAPQPTPAEAVVKNYYEVSKSCQIPHLGFLFEVVLGRRSDGWVVEVGAFDGISFSNSSCLAAAGWQCLFIEPVPEFAQQIRDRYPNNPRVEVVESAVGASTGSVELMVGGPLTSANSGLVNEYRGIQWSQRYAEDMIALEVPLARLEDILEVRDVPRTFDVLVVDVEGFEAEVFKGFDLRIWRPLMMIIELSDYHPDLTTMRHSDQALSRLIVSHGYEVIYKDAINTIFVRTDDAIESNQ